MADLGRDSGGGRRGRPDGALGHHRLSRAAAGDLVAMMMIGKRSFVSR